LHKTKKLTSTFDAKLAIISEEFTMGALGKILSDITVQRKTSKHEANKQDGVRKIDNIHSNMVLNCGLQTQRVHSICKR
jgi:hypothetical protein